MPPLHEFVPGHIGVMPMAAGYAAAPVGAREAVVNEVCEWLAGYQAGTGVRLPFAMYRVTAVR